MKVVLENSFEREAWELFLDAHRKWYKNHGEELVDMVNFMAEVYEKDEVVAGIAGRLVTSPEEIKTENGWYYRRLFGPKECKALIFRELREKRSGRLAVVVGYDGGHIDIEFDNGDRETIDKDDFEGFYDVV